MGLSDSQNLSNILIKSIDNSITGPQPGDLLNISQYKCEGNTHYTRRAMWGIAPQVKVRLRIISPADPCPVMERYSRRLLAVDNPRHGLADTGLECAFKEVLLLLSLAEQLLEFRRPGQAAGMGCKNPGSAAFHSGPHVSAEFGGPGCNYRPVVSPVNWPRQDPGRSGRAPYRWPWRPYGVANRPCPGH